jgi:hypothetical protein
MDQLEVLWKEYELQVGLYKHYLDLVLKFLAFYHVAIGAFLAFYLTRSDLSLFRWALWLPAIVSFVFAGVVIYRAILNAVSRVHVQALAKSLGFAGFQSRCSDNRTHRSRDSVEICPSRY